jgi:hypothetical protein
MTSHNKASKPSFIRVKVTWLDQAVQLHRMESFPTRRLLLVVVVVVGHLFKTFQASMWEAIVIMVTLGRHQNSPEVLDSLVRGENPVAKRHHRIWEVDVLIVGVFRTAWPKMMQILNIQKKRVIG